MKAIILLFTIFCIHHVASDPMWKVFCSGTPTYRGRADTIVNPGTVSGHVHRVAGGNGFNLGAAGRSNLADYNIMFGSSCTSCSISIDKTAYWHPDLYYQWPDGTLSLVPTAGLTVYYPSRSGSGSQAKPSFTAIPQGFRMLAGSGTRTTYNASSLADQAVSYACLNYNGPATPQTPGFPDVSTCKDGLRAQLWFPMCWDGVNLDTADHKSHLAYPDGLDSGNCPSSHPVRLPGVFFEALYSVSNFPAQSYQPFTWSVGDNSGYGFHGDFLNGWDTGIMQAALNDPSCDSTNTNNGNSPQNCKPLSQYVSGPNDACAQAGLLTPMGIPAEDLGLNHPILFRPGCNQVAGSPNYCGAAQPPTGKTWTRFVLKPKTSSNFVTAKNSQVNMLATFSGTPGYTEIWSIDQIQGSNWLTWQSELTTQYVTSPGGAPIICNRGSASTWEQFQFLPQNGGYYAILSNSNNMYHSTLSDGTIRANSNSIGDAQLFQLLDPILLTPISQLFANSPAIFGSNPPIPPPAYYPPPPGTPPPAIPPPAYYPPPPATPPPATPPPATPPPATPSGQCTVYAGTDFYGSDIANTPGTVANDCCTACAAHSGCFAWTFNGGTCFLKNANAINNPSANSGVTSGVLKSSTSPASPASGQCVVKPGIDYYGSDVGSTPGSQPSDCCTACVAKPGCAVWSFASGTCYLKSAAALSNPVSNSGVTGGSVSGISAATVDPVTQYTTSEAPSGGNTLYIVLGVIIAVLVAIVVVLVVLIVKKRNTVEHP